MAEYRSSGKELRKSPKGMIAGGILFVIAIVGIYFGIRIVQNIHPLTNDTQSSGEQQTTEIDIPIPSETTAPDENKIIFSYEALFRTDLAKGDLILVNRDYETSDIAEGLVSVYEKRNPHFTVRSTEVKLLEHAATALSNMMQGFYDATGHEDVQITGGYRTKAEQKKLYDKDSVTDNDSPDRTAAAGHSDHETGLSFDINLYSDGVAAEFDGTGDYAWLTEHCADYGFIQRYPADKVEQTKFSAEPWHFRYVGIPHAVYMTGNNLSLEEYLTLLQNYTYEGERLQLTDHLGNIYETFYVSAGMEDEAGIVEIPAPSDIPHTISGDNCSGFIVTYPTGETKTAAVTE